MKILYFSCHETLEHDELTTLDRLGHQVFSIGHYIDPRKPLHPTKDGALNIKFDEELLERYKATHNYEGLRKKFENLTINEILGAYYNRVKKEFAQLFDLVIISHFEENLTLNWESISNKPIIMRYIGQPQMHFSKYLKYTKTVAYSPTERYINRLSKMDAIIRPYVDTYLYSGWTGEDDYVLTINKWFKKRGSHAAWPEYNIVTSGMNRIVGGFENEDIEFSAGDLSPTALHDLRKKAGVYFSTCTKPGPFTYSFMEALSTGIPLVSVGPKIGNARDDTPTFEAHKFIENGVSGFWSDDLKELRGMLSLLIKDKTLAKSMSKAGREAAIKHFSFERNLNDWKELLRKV